MMTTSRVRRRCCDRFFNTLLLGVAHADALVLMDEKLGRNMAEYLGLKVTGTLGVLAKARSLV